MPGKPGKTLFAKQGQKKSDFFGKGAVLFCALVLIALTIALIGFIGSKGIATFTTGTVSVWDFLFGTVWQPERPGVLGGPAVGASALIVGSVATSLLAVAVSAPLSIITAVFMTEIAPSWGQGILQPAIELLAGIPSVVYGYIGLSILVPLIRGNLGGVGFSVLAGSLVLAAMVLPTVTSVAVDALKSLPRELKEAAYALGSTRWQTIRLVLLPAAKASIITGLVLGLARGFGEALAVQMVIGNRRLIPNSLLDPTITLASGITMDMGYSVAGSLWNNALWSMSLLLLLMSLFFIIVIRMVGKRGVYR